MKHYFPILVSIAVFCVACSNGVSLEYQGFQLGEKYSSDSILETFEPLHDAKKVVVNDGMYDEITAHNLIFLNTEWNEVRFSVSEEGMFYCLEFFKELPTEPFKDSIYKQLVGEYGKPIEEDNNIFLGGNARWRVRGKCRILMDYSNNASNFLSLRYISNKSPKSLRKLVID